MKKATILIIIVSVIILIIGLYLLYGILNPSSPIPTENSTIITPNTTNNSTIIPQNVPLTELSAVDANNKFAFDLYNQYKDDPEYKGKNIFYSPYSISTALAMTYEGARGKTADEMQRVFYFQTDAKVRRPAFAKIYTDLNKEDKPYRLSTANALWAEKTYNFLDDYKNTILTYYGGKTTNLDFVNSPEPSRLTINNWVEDQTNDKIKDLIPAGAIDSLTRMVLTNAIYFKADWQLPFKKEATYDQNFTLSDNSKASVKMMHQTDYFNYAEDSNVQILEMPYKGNDLSMLVLLPKSNNIQDAEESLSKLDELKNNLNENPVKVELSLPKFKFETEYMMADTLKKMGMPTAFDPKVADFSGMDGTKNLYISAVIHKAFVAVDENGTEAAAATAVIMSKTTGITISDPPKIFNADHPFIFVIQDKNSGEILFMGKVENPSQ